MANDHKKPYERPTVARLGTIRELTRGGGGTMRESGGTGSPKTKATGTSA
jgi:hypothetical protein